VRRQSDGGGSGGNAGFIEADCISCPYYATSFCYELQIAHIEFLFILKYFVCKNAKKPHLTFFRILMRICIVADV
jgi:hypothetical protein